MSSQPLIVLFLLCSLLLCCWNLDTAPKDGMMARAITVSAIVEHGSMEFTEDEEPTWDKVLVNHRYLQ